MVIYFLRHANAGTKHFSDSVKDEKRPIDKIGEEQSHDVGRALAAIGVTVNVIISSPLTRAMQTAAIVSQEIGHEEKLVLDDALRPEATLEKFKALLNRHKDKAAIMVVGHDPSMTDFVNRSAFKRKSAGGDRNEKGRRGEGGERLAQTCGAEMVHASESRAEDSAKLGEKVASENGLEIGSLLFDRPKFQFDPFRRGGSQKQAHRPVLMNAEMQLTHSAAASLIERARQSQ